jgi:hypothetical protein
MYTVYLFTQGKWEEGRVEPERGETGKREGTDY